MGTILEGSVRKSGDRVRVTAQLVNADDGYHIWSKRFDRELSDVFVIQDEIASSILEEFRLHRETRASGRTPLSVPAHDAYLKGMYSLNKWTESAVRQAIGERALRSGLVEYDRRHGWRGPLGHVDPAENWIDQLAGIP